MAKTTKHCILICNSPPYSVQTVESQTYFGLMIDQLAALMAEKQINFSIFSPRKMSFLYKLYEDAGGDLNQALNKNYAKDKRHLVLLRGFQLQERPLSPQMGSQTPAVIDQKASQNSPLPMTGLKRPHSPSLQSSTMASTVPNVTSSTNAGMPPMHGTGNQMMPRLPHSNIGNTDIQSPFPQPSKAPTPDTIVKQGRGSPVPISTGWSSQANTPTITSVSVSSSSSPTPPTVMSVLKGQLNMRPVRPGVQQQIAPTQHTMGLQQSAPTLVSLVSQPPQPIKQQNAAPIRPNQQIRNQQPVPSPFSAPQPSPSQPQPSPLPLQRAVASPSQSVPSPMQSSQQIATQQSFPQPVTTINQMNVSQPGYVSAPTSIGQSAANRTEQRRRIWHGIIEYQEKPVQPGPINPTNRITYTLNCQISCHVVNGEPEINADKWPEKLVLSLLPKQLIMRLFPMLKNGSYHISLHFSNDSDQGLSKLSKIMSTNWVSPLLSYNCLKLIINY